MNINEAKADAMRARQAYSRMESRAWTARELGEMLGEDFYKGMRAAKTSVDLAEQRVRRILEKMP